MRSILSSLLPLAVLAGLSTTTFAQAATGTEAASADTSTVRSSIDMLRNDIKQEKAYLIARNMSFTADESAEFWPLYNDYNIELNKLNDERLQLIKAYLKMLETMTDAQARILADELFTWEEMRTKLKRTWFKRFSRVVSAKKTAQFFQIENQINAAIDLKLMDSLPLLK